MGRSPVHRVPDELGDERGWVQSPQTTHPARATFAEQWPPQAVNERMATHKKFRMERIIMFGLCCGRATLPQETKNSAYFSGFGFSVACNSKEW